MAGLQCLLGWSPDAQLALDPKPTSGQERRKVSHGGPAALGGLPACDSLMDLHLYQTGMSVYTVGCWLPSRVMAALPNGVHPISERYGVESGAKRNATRSSWVFFHLFSCMLFFVMHFIQARRSAKLKVCGLSSSFGNHHQSDHILFFFFFIQPIAILISFAQFLGLQAHPATVGSLIDNVNHSPHSQHFKVLIQPRDLDLWLNSGEKLSTASSRPWIAKRH